MRFGNDLFRNRSCLFVSSGTKVYDPFLSYALQEGELLQVVAICQETIEQMLGEVDDIPIRLSLEIPPMRLSGLHKIHLARRNPELLEVYTMRTAAFGEQHDVVKRVTVREMKIGMGKQVPGKRLCYQLAA